MPLGSSTDSSNVSLRRLELGDAAIDRGGHLLLKRALATVKRGVSVEIRGSDPNLVVHTRAWARNAGHGFSDADGRIVLTRGAAEDLRWVGATRAEGESGGVADTAPATWGLALRGALVEAGSPPFQFPLAMKAEVWTDDAARGYAQAAAAQWDPATAIPWDARFDIPDEIEDAVVQLMTYLVENELAALVVPARFCAQVHPHFREIVQTLAIQAADEARHVEVFARRATLRRGQPGTSAAGGQRSLQTLVDEPDFALATFLLSVLGEGSFLSLLWFLHAWAPDPVTRQIARLTAQDEARHVAFGLAHLSHHVNADPTLRGRLAAAIEARHASLLDTAGLNADVYDALLLIAGGGWSPEELANGHDRVATLVAEMDAGRRIRLERLGFSAGDAAALSALHTRNFM